MAASLRLIGYRLMLGGPTNAWRMHFEQTYTQDEARRLFGDNVGAYEGREIEREVPDFIVVGREDNQEVSFRLWEFLRRLRPVTICAYSGVFQSRFELDRFDGLIATDLPSRILGRLSNTPSLRFRPFFDFESFPYAPMEATNRIVLRSYINDFGRRFPRSYDFYEKCVRAVSDAFGERVVIENLSGLPLDRVRELMRESTATLHIKDEEGFGWSLLESLSTGRPILSQSGLSRNMAYLEWCVDGKSSFLFDDENGLVALLETFFRNPGDVALYQKTSADHVRAEYRSVAFAHELKRFLESLAYLEKLRWSKHWFNDELRGKGIEQYEPNLDPNHRQGFEALM